MRSGRERDVRHGSLTIEFLMFLLPLVLLASVVFGNHPVLFARARVRTGVHFVGNFGAAGGEVTKAMLDKSIYIVQKRDFDLSTPEKDHRSHPFVMLTGELKSLMRQTYYTGGITEKKIPWSSWWIHQKDGVQVESMKGWRNKDSQERQALVTRDAWSFEDVKAKAWLGAVGWFAVPDEFWGGISGGIINSYPSSGTVDGAKMLEL